MLHLLYPCGSGEPMEKAPRILVQHFSRVYQKFEVNDDPRKVTKFLVFNGDWSIMGWYCMNWTMRRNLRKRLHSPSTFWADLEQGNSDHILSVGPVPRGCLWSTVKSKKYYKNINIFPFTHLETHPSYRNSWNLSWIPYWWRLVDQSPTQPHAGNFSPRCRPGGNAESWSSCPVLPLARFIAFFLTRYFFLFILYL